MSRCPIYERVYSIDIYSVETLPEKRESSADIPLTHRCDDGEGSSLNGSFSESGALIIIFQFSLFLAEALQAIGGIVNISWVQSGKVEAGSFCRAQG